MPDGLGTKGPRTHIKYYLCPPARRLLARALAVEPPNRPQSENNIDPLFRLANKYREMILAARARPFADLPGRSQPCTHVAVSLHSCLCFDSAGSDAPCTTPRATRLRLAHSLLCALCPAPASASFVPLPLLSGEKPVFDNRRIASSSRLLRPARDSVQLGLCSKRRQISMHFNR